MSNMKTLPYRIEKNGCWIWLRSTIGKRNYAQLGAGKVAHKVYWEERNGKVPDGYQLHHTCENKLCVNIDHLELVTPIQHARKHAILTEKQVGEIRALRGKVSQRNLAKQYGVSQSNICRIQSGEIW